MSTNRPEYTSLEWYRKALVFVFIAVAAWYLTWRLGTFNPDALIFSYVLYGAEIFGITTTALHLFMTWRLTERHSPDPEPGRKVDVFIPTINEPVELVRRTALTARAMDYEHQTWILDDGNRPEMRRMAESLGLKYIARTSNENAKAGNLNNALYESDADFIAIFDADHAPKRNFLTKTLGFFRDEKVAFVQTPQDFYNLDSFQHRHKEGRKRIWTEQSLFFRVIQRGKDYWNAAFFCGSCAIIRRSALLEIGGFATGTVTEDLHTSIRMHKLGYKSVYLSETLALGIAPAQIEPFLQQRVRWGQGAMQVWRQEGIFFARGLTWAQKFNYFASMLTYFDGWQKLVFYTAPVIVLLTGVMPINTLSTEFFLHFIPYFLLTFWVFEEVGRGYGNVFNIEQYNMARFAAFSWSTLGLFKRNLKFKVTNKNLHRTGFFNLYLVPQYMVFLLSAAALPIGITLYFYTDHLTALSLCANVFWASMNGALAWMVLLFTQNRAGFQRQNYRFRIPMMCTLRIGGGAETTATIRNISSAGMQLSSGFDQFIHVNDKVEGKVWLPDGMLPIHATVRSLARVRDTQKIKAVGCSFKWENQEDRDRLDLFLYGSDLQWQLNQYEERQPTILESLFASFSRPSRQPEPVYTQWDSALGRNIADMSPEEFFSGAISQCRDSGKHAFLSFKPMALGTDIETSVFSDGGQKKVRGRVVNQKLMENPLANLYVYQLETVVEKV